MEFNYKDGGESKLYEIVSKEDFNEDESWKNHIDDWAVFYHLSPLRKNLLRWIKINGEASILEIGAGCGAITKSLCEVKNIKRHLALEGSNERAEITKKRCVKNKHVEVLNINFNEFETDEKFDFVFVIGVLEYSGKYMSGSNPYHEFIKKAKSFLNENGTMVLAIENKIGHKYLAGYNEDHYAEPYVGISDYPKDIGIRTFDKFELNNMLKSSGLDNIDYYYPYPDYKLPKFIISDSAFSSKNFNYLDILDFPTVDKSDPHTKPNFNEKKFLKSINNLCDSGIFMNSFLVFASKNKKKYSEFLLAKFNNERLKKYQNEKYFIEQDYRIKIKTEGHKNEISHYHENHENLMSLLIDNYFNNDKFIELIKKWIDLLEKKSITLKKYDEFETYCRNYIKVNIYENEKKWIESKFIDLIPNNVLLSENNETKIIDQEWSLDIKYIPMQYIIDRGIYYLISKIKSLHNIDIIVEGKWNIPGEFYITKDNHFYLKLMELYFQKKVHKKITKISENEIYKIKNEIFVEKKIPLKKKLLLFGIKIISKIPYTKSIAFHVINNK